jgi:hypothetical protein
MLYEVCCSSSNRGLYVTVHSSSVLLLAAILSSVSKWPMSPSTDWPFWDASRILVTYKEIFCPFNVCSGGLE